jgi:hypothetical protein
MPTMYLGALQHAFAACLEQQPQQPASQGGEEDEAQAAQREGQQEAYEASLQDFFRLAQKIAATYAGFSLSRPAIMQVGCRGMVCLRARCCCCCSCELASPLASLPLRWAQLAVVQVAGAGVYAVVPAS